MKEKRVILMVIYTQVHFINIFMSGAALGIRNRKSSETHSVLKGLP